MPWQIIVIGAFMLGLGAGVLLGGYLVVKLLTLRSMIVLTPERELLLECQVECLKKYPFGSPEFDDCVGRCYDEKRRQLVLGRETR
jgi:hypothetical protein